MYAPHLGEFYIKMEISNQMHLGILALPNNSTPAEKIRRRLSLQENIPAPVRLCGYHDFIYHHKHLTLHCISRVVMP